MTKSIMLVGVGGQGTITASKLLTLGLMDAGYDVKMSEIHGMSQRGGSVSSQVRYGEKVHSPVIELGGADILVSFEIVEAMRFLPYLKRGGKIVVNNHAMNSVTTLMGKEKYPVDTLKDLQDIAPVLVVEASKLADEMGNGKVMNCILLGVLVRSMNLGGINWDRILEANIKPKFIEMNKEAFLLGMNLAETE